MKETKKSYDLLDFQIDAINPSSEAIHNRIHVFSKGFGVVTKIFRKSCDSWTMPKSYNPSVMSFRRIVTLGPCRKHVEEL